MGEDKQAGACWLLCVVEQSRAGPLTTMPAEGLCGDTAMAGETSCMVYT